MKMPNDEVKALNIRGVPGDVWERVRHQALASRRTVKDYVIETLAQAGPLPLPSPGEDPGSPPPKN